MLKQQSACCGAYVNLQHKQACLRLLTGLRAAATAEPACPLNREAPVCLRFIFGEVILSLTSAQNKICRIILRKRPARVCFLASAWIE